MRILIVDDEQIIRKGLAKMISRFGERFSVIGEAENGKQALDMMQSHCPDLVVTDVRMPEMDGIELCSHIDRINRSGRIEDKIMCIILSGYSEFSYARDAMKYGVSEYILKPVNEEFLKNTLERIEEQLQKERSMSQGLRRYYDNALPALEEKKLRDILFDRSANEESILRELRELGIEFKHKAFLLVCVKLDEPSRVPETARESIKSRIDFQRFSEFNDENLKIYYTIMANNELVMLLNFKVAENEPGMDRERLSHLKDRMVKSGGCTVSFGVSSVFFSLAEIGREYGKAERALEQAGICGGDGVYYPIDFPGERKNGNKTRVIQEAAAYIASGYAQNLTLEAVSSRFHLSSSYFSDMFKKEMGIRFIDYLTKVRIEKAKELLKNNKYKIFEVAGLVGYEDANYFSRTFSREVGLSPAEYRNQL